MAPVSGASAAGDTPVLYSCGGSRAGCEDFPQATRLPLQLALAQLRTSVICGQYSIRVRKISRTIAKYIRDASIDDVSS
jgi:hypothetical protein